MALASYQLQEPGKIRNYGQSLNCPGMFGTQRVVVPWGFGDGAGLTAIPEELLSQWLAETGHSNVPKGCLWDSHGLFTSRIPSGNYSPAK